MGTVHAFKSRSPKEISELFDFIMARPDLAVDAPQGLAQRSADLTKMFDSDWQTRLATLSSYMGENTCVMLIDFNATYSKRVFITNVKGTFFGMSESEEASKRR